MKGLLFQIVFTLGVLYVMLFITYWKWVFIRKYLMTKEQVEDQDLLFKAIFVKLCWLFGIKFRAK